VLAAIRADDVNLPLFLHVLGAMLLLGTLLAVSTALRAARGREAAAERALTRFGLWTLLVGVVPAYVVMRVGAQWTEAAEDLPDVVEDSAWLGIGYVTADAGALLIVVSSVLAGMGLRRLRFDRGAGFGRAVGVIAAFLLVAYVIATWAMSAKPD
jgi:hypothetical protein